MKVWVPVEESRDPKVGWLYDEAKFVEFDDDNRSMVVNHRGELKSFKWIQTLKPTEEKLIPILRNCN